MAAALKLTSRLGRRLLPGLAVCLVLLLAACRPTHAAQNLTGSLRIEQSERNFRLYVPSGYRPDAPAALVINLHGDSSAAEHETLSGMNPVAEQAGFLALYPEAAPGGWQTGPNSPDVAFMRALVAYLQTQYNLDPARIYVAGLGRGAELAHRLACDAADLFAAAALVSTRFDPASDCLPAQPIRILALHGLQDLVTPEAAMLEWAAAWAERNRCTGELQVSRQIAGVIEYTWRDCPQGVQILLLENHTEGWPDPAVAGLNPAQSLWQFFDK